MIDWELFLIFLGIWCLVAVAVFIVLFFIPAPYGKIKSKGWGPSLNSSVAWLVMESVSWSGMVALFLLGNNRSWPVCAFLLLWLGHYLYRSLLFPFLRSKASSVMPVMVMFSGMGFNVGNAFFNGFWLFHQPGAVYGNEWFLDPRFIIGTVLFLTGFTLNVTSDRILRRLRNGRGAAYKIPYGGLFRLVSCPNYLGEIIEWIGWAVLTWSPAGAAFALWTIANLGPRALSYHAWYRKTFPDYPAARKALIPFIL